VLTVYSLKNCDTCVKAFKWLNEKSIPHTRHDVRADGLSHEDANSIVSALGWETALNRRSTTWRQLGDDDKVELNDTKATALIVQHPTLLKRPVFVGFGKVVSGFNAASMTAVEEMNQA